jgi:hypothetical protein
MAVDLYAAVGTFEPVALTAVLEDATILFFSMALGSSLSSFGDLSTVEMAIGKQGGRRAMEQGQSRLTSTPLFIRKMLLQVLTVKSASQKMHGNLTLHVSQGERNMRSTTPTTHKNQGNASVNVQGPVIS